jgi:hypothetical protein
VAEAPGWESGWRVLCPERRAASIEHRSGSGVSGVCQKEGVGCKREGTLSRAPHLGLRVAFAEAERHITLYSRKGKLRGRTSNKLIAGRWWLGTWEGPRDADLIADHCPLETREGGHRRHLMSFFMHKDFLEARQRRTRS